jgi:tetratricopeptide (TPR) repeat protein
MRNLHTISLLTVLFFFVSSHLFGQKTFVNEKPQNIYNRAIDLYKDQNFGAAEKLFEQYKLEVDDPNNALVENASYYQTICAVQTNKKNALIKVREFATSYPESAWLPSINFELGNLYYQQRKYTEALESYKSLTPRKLSKSQRIEYYYKKGYCEMESDMLDAAYSSFSQVKDTRSTYAQPAFFYSAHILYSQGKYSEALKDFKKIENNKRYSKYIPIYLVHIYYEMGDYEKAIDEGKKFIENANYKTKPEIARLIANAFFSLNKFEEALEYYDVYEKTARKKISADEQYRIGYCKFIAKDYKSAIYNFQEACRDDEAFAQNAWYHLGFCYLNTGEQQFAQNAFLKAYKEGENKSVSTDALYNYIKITIERGSDPYNDPVAIMEDFITKNPDLPRINEAYDLLAQLYVTSNNYRGALQSIEKTRNPNPKLREIYQQIAFAQGVDYFNRGAYTDAIGYFEKSLKYSPNKKLEAKSIYWIGDSFYHLKQFRDAQGMFKKFLSSSYAERSDLFSLGLYNYAYTNFNLKHYNEAIEYFNKFLNQDGNAQNLISDARLRLADSYYITKNYAQASTWYNKVIASGIEGTDYALYQKAFCYGAEDSFGKKISTLKTLISKYPNSMLYDDALFEIATTSLILNDQRSAIVYFDKLVKEKPGSSLAKKALIKMGFVYYNNKQNDRAISTLKEVINKYPASLEAREAMNTLQNIYMDIGRVDEYFAYAKSLDFIQVSTSEEDSLTFTTGENYYMANDCFNAINSLKNYLVKFPNGGFVLSSYYYLSDCFEKQNMLDQAMEYYKKIIEFPDNQYTDDALLKAARIEFDKKIYFDAFNHYSRLAKITETQGMRVEGNDGAMRSAYMMGKFNEASEYANRLLQTEKVSEDQIVFAHYILAKSALELNNISVAEQEFGITDKLTSGEFGAEAKYQLALINFQRKDLDQAENLIYQIPEQYADFDYWIARGFILLADIYLERDNQFQAEQTLQSIIDNYPREDLKNVAREKLEEIKKEAE